jgi:sulfatase modifying factor 1
MRSMESPPRLGQMIRIPSGIFVMGSDTHYPEEAPAHAVMVEQLWIDRYPVTNAEFARFVDETGHITLAEKPADPTLYPDARPDLLVPSSVVFQKPSGPVSLQNPYDWWTYVAGADWRHPRGPDSSLEGLAEHPVVHVAYEDAEAYARWAGKALPTEAQWEYAARGGLQANEYTWGNDFMPDGKQMANTWQGPFPIENLLEDGYEWTSPVGAFPPNGYGLYDMAGNVWEWTNDWYGNYAVTASCCESAHRRMPDARIGRRVIKGGSYLCAPNYCHRYRPAARLAQTADTSTCHLGFRCVLPAR